MKFQSLFNCLAVALLHYQPHIRLTLPCAAFSRLLPGVPRKKKNCARKVQLCILKAPRYLSVAHSARGAHSFGKRSLFLESISAALQCRRSNATTYMILFFAPPKTFKCPALARARLILRAPARHPREIYCGTSARREIMFSFHADGHSVYLGYYVLVHCIGAGSQIVRFSGSPVKH